MKFRLTSTGKLFLGVLGLLYLASLTSQSGLLLLLVGLVLGCFAVNLILARRSLQDLELWAPRTLRLTEGQRLWQPWRLVNHGKQAAGCLQLESPAGTLFRSRSLAPRHEQTLVPDLTFNQRGVFAHDQLLLRSRHPFGFLCAERRVQLEGEVVVHPAVFATEPPHASGYDVVTGGKHKGQRRSSSGLHFAGVRPLQPGDPLKQIHWRSSAKGQGLMVKSYDEELSGRVSIIMDCGHTGELKTLDDCIRATASLIFAALDAGHHVEWIDLTRRMPWLVPPFADGHEILDALARVPLEAGCLTSARLGQAVDRLGRRGTVQLVLTGFNPAVGEIIQRLQAEHRTVGVYLPVSCPTPPGFSELVVKYTATAILEPAAAA